VIERYLAAMRTVGRRTRRSTVQAAAPSRPMQSSSYPLPHLTSTAQPPPSCADRRAIRRQDQRLTRTGRSSRQPSGGRHGATGGPIRGMGVSALRDRKGPRARGLYVEELRSRVDLARAVWVEDGAVTPVRGQLAQGEDPSVVVGGDLGE
jgi:hypothetical protein